MKNICSNKYRYPCICKWEQKNMKSTPAWCCVFAEYTLVWVGYLTVSKVFYTLSIKITSGKLNLNVIYKTKITTKVYISSNFHSIISKINCGTRREYPIISFHSCWRNLCKMSNVFKSSRSFNIKGGKGKLFLTL